MADGRTGSGATNELIRRLDRWVEASLITPEQRNRIVAFETPEGSRSGARVPLAAEAIGYAGAILALSALTAWLSRSWDRTSQGIRVGTLATAVGVLLIAGWRLGRSGEAAVRRLSSVLWFLSVGLALMLIATVAELARLAPENLTLATSAGTAAYAGALYLQRRWALQHLALFGALVFTVSEVAYRLNTQHAITWVGPAIWGFGMFWAILAAAGILGPVRMGLLLGVIGTMFAPISDDLYRLGILLALAAAAAAVAASVAIRQTILLGVGAVGLAIFTPWAIAEFLGRSSGPIEVLLIAGVTLFGVALLVARLRPLARERGGGPA